MEACQGCLLSSAVPAAPFRLRRMANRIGEYSPPMFQVARQSSVYKLRRDVEQIGRHGFPVFRHKIWAILPAFSITLVNMAVCRASDDAARAIKLISPAFKNICLAHIFLSGLVALSVLNNYEQIQQTRARAFHSRVYQQS